MSAPAPRLLYVPDLGRPGTLSGAAASIDRSAGEVAGLGTDLGATIDWAVRVGRQIPLAGSGATAERWSALAVSAAHDVSAVRVLEPHVDALGILAEAGDADLLDADALARLGVDDGSSWGVYAAEGPQRLQATRGADEEWKVDGTKTWCSLASDVSHALVTAWVGPDTRRLFAVSLRHPSVHPHPGPWVARGLRGIVSAPVDFTGTPAVPVGGDQWYLRRPGFEWGGMGVAAAWWGGASPLLDALRVAASRENADQLAFALLGEADAAAWAARSVLADAAARVDGQDSDHRDRLVAERVRSVVAASTERVLTAAEHALGPGPLTTDEAYARRMADLRLYVRQHHAERDLARIGRLVGAG